MLPMTRKDAASAGSMHYLTGKPCIRGHLSPRLTSTRQCIDCVRTQAREWAKAHPDRIKVLKHQTRQRNKESVTEYKKKWAKQNPDAYKAMKRRDYLKHRETRMASNRKWAKENPELRRYHGRAYIHRHPERHAARTAARRAFLLGVPGTYDGHDVQQLFRAQNGKCVGCGALLSAGRFHVDHKKPISKGGTNWPENLQVLCGPCNLRKHDMDYEEWLAMIAEPAA